MHDSPSMCSPTTKRGKVTITQGLQLPLRGVSTRHGAEAVFGFGFMKPWFLGHGFGFGFITFLRHWLRLRLHNFPRTLASASASCLSQASALALTPMGWLQT